MTEGYEHPDAARMAALRRVFGEYRVGADIYPGIADRFLARQVKQFAEVGGGRGPVSEILAKHGVAVLVVDKDESMAAECVAPVVRGDLRALPLPDSSVDAVAAINCLYFLDDPGAGIREAWRILKPGGLFVASSPSRWNDPELEGIDPRWGEASTFDAEDAPGLVAAVFGDVEVDTWEIVGYDLPNRDAIADYLHGFDVPDWEQKAAALRPPMRITKRGAEVWAYK